MVIIKETVRKAGTKEVFKAIVFLEEVAKWKRQRAEEVDIVDIKRVDGDNLIQITYTLKEG
jgi:hypothetical protein